jgi:ssDNA-binding Zn-finger/Zn-ribbon topoisomerase 1
MGPFASFLGCRRYPACAFVKHPEDDPIEPLPGDGDTCPKCETTGATLTTRRARRTGALLLGCTKYPRCDYVSRPASLAETVAEPS